MHGAHDIRGIGFNWIAIGAAHNRLGCVVNDDLGLDPIEQVADLGEILDFSNNRLHADVDRGGSE
jgi:hypothetical protein